MSGREEDPAHPPAPPRAPAQILTVPTLPLTALDLVFAVLAVVLLVAGPGHGDAPPARAGEVVGRAFGLPPTYFVKETSVSTTARPRPASSQPRTEGFLPKIPLRSRIPDPSSTVCAGAARAEDNSPSGQTKHPQPKQTPKGYPCPRSPLCPPALTGAVALVRVIAAVVGAVAHPAGRVAQGRVLALLERDALHPQLEVAAAVGGGCEESQQEPR